MIEFRKFEVNLRMITKIYKILPQFLKNIMVEIHRDLRLLWFIFLKSKSTRNCKNKSFIEFQKNRIYGPLKHICYAPYTSMFFARNGKVSPCYASYNNESSSISESTISEIWFNGSFKKIRQEHKNCEFDSSCKFCSQLIQNQSYGSLLINKYEHYAFSKSKYPAIMEFEISNKCNLSCIMCDSNLSSSIELEKTDNSSGNQFYSKKFIEELKEFIPHLQLAEFTGGDPFLIEEYYQIWDLINKINTKCHILITTNANTMNPRIEKMLETHKNIHFNVSIDSLEKGNYERIRKGGNLEFALQNLDKFIDYTKKHKTNLNILVCPMTVNKNELYKFVNFANEKDICVFYHTVVKPKELSLKYTNKTELQQTIVQMEQYIFPKSTKNQRTNAQNFQNLILLLKNWQKETVVSNDEQEKILSEAESNDIIIKKIANHKYLESKLLVLLNMIEAQDRSKMILNKLANTNNEIFIEYLESKDIDELTNICLNFK